MALCTFLVAVVVERTAQQEVVEGGGLTAQAARVACGDLVQGPPSLSDLQLPVLGFDLQADVRLPGLLLRERGTRRKDGHDAEEEDGGRQEKTAHH